MIVINVIEQRRLIIKNQPKFILFPTEQGSGRLAAALLDHGASTWGTSNETHTVSPRPVKRLGPFKRPLTHTGPQTAPPAPQIAPAPVPRRNR